METNPDRVGELDHMRYIVHMVGEILRVIHEIDASNGSRSLNELRILNLLARSSLWRKKMAVMEVASALQIGKSTVSKIIGRLAAEGIVEVSRDPNDSRKHMLSYSPYAMQKTRQFCDMVHEVRREAAARGLPVTKLYTVE